MWNLVIKKYDMKVKEALFGRGNQQEGEKRKKRVIST
jgi:hypothetical protein